MTYITLVYHHTITPCIACYVYVMTRIILHGALYTQTQESMLCICHTFYHTSNINITEKKKKKANKKQEEKKKESHTHTHVHKIQCKYWTDKRDTWWKSFFLCCSCHVHVYSLDRKGAPDIQGTSKIEAKKKMVTNPSPHTLHMWVSVMDDGT